MSKQKSGQPDSDPAVHSITDARTPHTDEIRSRMIKYSISMGIRVICLILIFFVDGWLQWVFIAGAVFLPYFAVIIANGGSDTSKIGHSGSLLDSAPLRELESGAPARPPQTPGGQSDDVLSGEVVDAEEEPKSPTQEPHTR